MVILSAFYLQPTLKLTKLSTLINSLYRVLIPAIIFNSSHSQSLLICCQDIDIL